jgi:hypothetical protein
MEGHATTEPVDFQEGQMQLQQYCSNVGVAA